MPKSKHAFLRYQALDKCFRNKSKRYYIEDLVNACRIALEEFTDSGEGVQKRQVYNDIVFMQSLNGYNAPIEKKKDGRKVQYFYEDADFSITNQPLNEAEATELKETLITLNRFKGMPQFEWIESMTTRLQATFKFGEQANQVIEFEQNEFLKGKDFIHDLYHAIVNKTVLSVEYESFHSEENHTIEFHPYYLKQYNNRWFVFGKNPQFPNLTNLALDRLSSFEQTNKDYLETDIDFSEYFEDIIGVSYPLNSELVEIELKANKKLWPYIKTKPIHGSQKVKEVNDEYTLFTLKLVPNYELESKLLNFGEQIEVISPDFVRNKLAIRIAEMNKKYNCAN